MRKYGITFLALLLCLYVKGQTNTFPSSGNVGIGIINPTQKLHIHNGNLLISNGNQTIQSELASSSDYSRFMFNGNKNFIISYGANHAEAYKLALKANNTSGKIALWTNSAERFVLDQNGKVGIGVSSPKEMLHVAQGIIARRSHFSTVPGSSGNSWVRDTWMTSNAGIQWDEESNLWIRTNFTYNDFGGVVWQDEGTYFIRVPTGTKLEYTNQEFLNSAFLFANINSGNVGIGTTNPTHKLSVNGTIRAKEVKVESSGWSDFVFEENYPLKSLTEVEAFIKENGHLPDIPSAKDVEENGVNVGEMEAKLLQKIEELTLYVIELQKQIKELKENQ